MLESTSKEVAAGRLEVQFKRVLKWAVKKHEKFRYVYPVLNPILPKQEAEVLKVLNTLSRRCIELWVSFQKNASVKILLTEVPILRTID
jgi:hypothetical protein